MDTIPGCQHMNSGNGIAASTITLSNNWRDPIFAISLSPVEILTLERRPSLFRCGSQKRHERTLHVILPRCLSVFMQHLSTNTCITIEFTRSLSLELLVSMGCPAKLQKVNGCRYRLLKLTLHWLVKTCTAWHPWLILRWSGKHVIFLLLLRGGVCGCCLVGFIWCQCHLVCRV